MLLIGQILHTEVKITVLDVMSVGSYFHVSSVLAQDLKAPVETNGFPESLHWPDYN